MYKLFLKIAGISGALAVILGAFAAHALRDRISNHSLETFETGVRYQFYHTIALVATALIMKENDIRFLKLAGCFFIAGMILFCFSLYFLACLQASVSPDYKWIGLITPIGGVAFIAGWILLTISISKIH